MKWGVGHIYISLKKNSGNYAVILPHVGVAKITVPKNCQLDVPKTGKVNFCTGTGRKAFFEFFSAWFWTPPGTNAFTAKKRQIHLYRPFFSPWHGLFRKKGGTGAGIRFHFPCQLDMPKRVFVVGLWGFQEVSPVTSDLKSSLRSKAGFCCKRGSWASQRTLPY